MNIAIKKLKMIKLIKSIKLKEAEKKLIYKINKILNYLVRFKIIFQIIIK